MHLNIIHIMLLMTLITAKGYGNAAILTPVANTTSCRYTVSGSVTDSEHRPICNAVVLFGYSGDESVEYGITDTCGVFTCKVSSGYHRITISQVQYKDYTDSVVICRDTCLTPYILSERIEVLDEVVVRANFIKRQGSSFTMAVKGNPLAEDRSTLSFLNQLPGVRGLSVNNRLAAVYINDREIKMPPDQIMKYLSNLPTESIEHVKVVPVKDVKGKASGQKSAIYVTLRKADGERYCSGQASLSPSVNIENGAFSGDVSGSFGYFDNRLSSLTYFSTNLLTSEICTSDSEMSDGQTEHSSSDRSFYSFIFDQSLVYDINSRHSIGIGLNMLCKPNEKSTSAFSTSDGLSFGMNTTNKLHTANAVLNYKYCFGKRNSSLRFAAEYMHRNNSYSEYNIGAPADFNDVWYDTPSGTWGMTADLNLNLTDNTSLDIGTSLTSMSAVQDYTFVTGEAVAPFKYKEGIMGIYAQGYTSVADGKIDITAGLRYEHAGINAESQHDADKHSFDDFFPSADITYNFDKSGYHLSLSYDRSVTRPTMSNYNPFVYRSGEHIYYTEGISDIVPEFENTIMLSQVIDNKHTIGLSYIWKKNIYDSYYLSDGENIIETTGNIGSSRGVEMLITTRFWIVKKILWFNAFLTGGYKSYTHGMDGTSDTWSGNGNASLVCKLPENWKIWVSGFASSPTKTPTTWVSGHWNLNFGIDKAFGKGWNVGIATQNLVGSDKIRVYSRIPEVPYQSISRNYFKFIGMTITYKFDDFMGKRASMINDVRLRSSTNK